MKIKSWLGHKLLEVTQIYLDSEMHDPQEWKELDRAGKFLAELDSTQKSGPHAR
jgi:hypothetical protein